MKENNLKDTEGGKADADGVQDDEDIDIMCNSSCNIHYHIRKHAKSVLEWLKSIFKKLMLFI